MGAVATYVITLLAEILEEEPEREKRFDWAVGDPSPKTGRSVRLPFDAVWESRALIIEVDEDQHRRATPFFDKPERITVSGVHRGEQRALYDGRKRAAAQANGYRVVEIPWDRLPHPNRRDRAADTLMLVDLLRREGVV